MPNGSGSLGYLIPCVNAQALQQPFANHPCMMPLSKTAQTQKEEDIGCDQCLIIAIATK